MSGQDAQRGFIFQSIIAMIECLDRDDWDEVKVEPDTDTALNKVDIQLYCDGKIKSAIQVKSSINKFGLPKVKGWLVELEKDAPDAEEVLLYLVGDSFTEDCEKYIGQNSDKIKSISFNYLKDICMGKIHGYVKKACPGEDVRIKDLDQIEANLFTGTHRNSIAHERLTRDAFEEAFRSVLAVRLYDRLMSTFANERKGHPSIRMMEDLDPNLFPKGLPEIKSDNRLAVVDKESPRAIKEMILDSWKHDDKRHILLVGEGGIGKTVAMLTLPEEEWFRQYRIPVIYVPLQRLDKRDGKLDDYLEDKLGAVDYNRIIELANQKTEGRPRLLLLLDGFNEIPDKYKGTTEKFIRDWMEKPGVQIITTSRLGFALENRFLRYQLQILPPKTVESFLLSVGIENEHLPKKNDPIWKVINVPLMLTLYTRIGKVMEVAEEDHSSIASLLDWKKAVNAAHIIWNYLQMELYHCIYKADTSYSPMQYVTAILLVAPYVCCQMSYKMKFYINQEEMQGFIIEALSFYGCRQNLVSRQFLNLRRKHDHHSKEELFEIKMAGVYSQILVESIALFQEQEGFDENGDLVYTYSLMHQNFRDALAAFFISSCLPGTSDRSEKTQLLDYADYYVKNYIAEFLSDGELISVWDKHREEEPEDGHITWILMDIIGRKRDYDYSELDFSGLDLTGINLHQLLSRRLDICPLPQNAELLNKTKISFENLLPEGHADIVTSASYSSDGKHLASGSSDKTVRIWDLENGTSRVLEGHTDYVASVSYSPDGRYVASGSSDKTVRIWNLENGTSRVLKGHIHGVQSVSYSPDGRHVASGSGDNTVRIWDLESGTSRVLKGHTIGAVSVSYSPDGKYLANSSWGIVHIWNLENGTSRVLEGHTDYVASVSYSPDGRHVASGSGDNTVRIWDLESGTSRVLKGHIHGVQSVSYSPDGRYVASGSGDNTVRIWDLESGTSRVLKGHTSNVTSVSYSPDRRHLVSASSDKTVRIWDLENGTSRVLEGHTNNVTSVSCSPDGKNLARGSGDGTVRIWDLENGTSRVLEGHVDRVTSMSYSPDRRHLVSASSDKTVRIWDLENGTCSVLKDHAHRFESVSYSPDGRYLASGSRDGTVRIWDLENGTSRVLEGHVLNVESVSYSPDGRYLASGSRDGTVRIWDLENGTSHVLKDHAHAVKSVSYSPDGKHLAYAHDKKVLIWDLKSSEKRELSIGEVSNDGLLAIRCILINKTSEDVIGAIFGATLGVTPGVVLLTLLGTLPGAILGTIIGALLGAIIGFVLIFIILMAISFVMRSSTGLSWGLEGLILGAILGTIPGAVLVNRFLSMPVAVFVIIIGAIIGAIIGRLVLGFVLSFNLIIDSLSYSPDGRHLAGISNNGRVYIWDLENGTSRVLKGVHKDKVINVSYSLDGRSLIGESNLGHVYIWDTVRGKIVKKYRFIENVNLIGANFMQAIVSKKDREQLRELGAKA